MRRLLTLALVLSVSLLQAKDAQIGLRQQLNQIVIPGPELMTKPIDAFESPVVIRIVAAYPHGSDFRYDMEYHGLDMGTYNLIDYLQVKADGSAPVDVPPIEVTFHSVLRIGEYEPEPLVAKPLPKVGGYRALIKTGIIIWIVGFLVIWLLRKRTSRGGGDSEAAVSFADQLRPKVEAAIAGTLEDSERADLERMLLKFWRRRLDLQATAPEEAMAQLRKHEEAGPLLIALEEWLHRPNPPKDVDVVTLLGPYREIIDQD